MVVAISAAAQEWIRRGVPESLNWIPILAILGAVFYMIWLTCPGASFWRSLKRLSAFAVAWWLAAFCIGRALARVWPLRP